MRQFAGFGTPEETNARYKALLDAGGTGLSVAFDLPTLMGRDPDHPLSLGEVGKCGVAISSLADMETLLDGIPRDQVSTSMTNNGPAAMLFCFYVPAAARQAASSALSRMSSRSRAASRAARSALTSVPQTVISAHPV
jgi:methylmalonyl-CoA mutase N-terminal domain/subunit